MVTRLLSLMICYAKSFMSSFKSLIFESVNKSTCLMFFWSYIFILAAACNDSDTLEESPEIWPLDGCSS